jgi:hypothetical protein
MWENEACARSTTYLKFGAEQSAPTQKNFSESLILAQNERWQRGLGMQVERSAVCSNTGRREWRKGEERVDNLSTGWG